MTDEELLKEALGFVKLIAEFRAPSFQGAMDEGYEEYEAAKSEALSLLVRIARRYPTWPITL